MMQVDSWADMAEEEEVALTANDKRKTLDARLSWSKIVGNIPVNKGEDLMQEIPMM